MSHWLMNRWLPRNTTRCLAVAVFALSLALRLPLLDAMVNVDMYHLWTPRIARFWSALLQGNFADTYQTHHPGVTFMWAAGALWRVFGVSTGHLDAHRLWVATLPVAIVGSLFPAAVLVLMGRILGNRLGFASILTALLIATEPLFLAHSANAHLDMLVTSFAWSALLCAIVTIRFESYRWAMACGALLGVALLTKLCAAGYALGVALLFVLPSREECTRIRLRFRLLTVVVGAALGTTFLLWPALWVSPIQTITQLRQGLLGEIGKRSAFMFLGNTGKLVLPRSTYGVFALFLATPEVVLPVLLGGMSLLLRPSHARRLAWQVTVGTLPIALFIGGGSHVVTRYLVPMLPWAVTLSALVVEQLVLRVKHRTRFTQAVAFPILLVATLAILRVVRTVTLYPLPIAYCSSWTGIECSEVFHLGWGEGLKEAATCIENRERHRFGNSPIYIYGSGYASTMGVWSQVKLVSRVDDAQLLVDYIADSQRRVASSLAIGEYVNSQGKGPICEVVLHGRPYVRVYAGPGY